MSQIVGDLIISFHHQNDYQFQNQFLLEGAACLRLALARMDQLHYGSNVVLILKKGIA
ncbi:hypothetical protein [Candidatus Coxiella mudrowiae]|uniref:hypothetical protein n=1 Tax=Candidatus Coxiella mudrowiae TaxID=2054173 RepID=UPI001561F28D|nr:hypothetical protein [Candidatus Coxiella mudrowiae]